MCKDNTITQKETVCPICGKTHSLEVKSRKALILIKGKTVQFDQIYCFCPNASEDENEFELGYMVNLNLHNAMNAYRKQKGLLTSDK